MALSLGGGAMAVAQTTAQAPAPTVTATTGNSGELQEVTVTAQRRAQNIQNVPITVNAVDTIQLQRSGVESTVELPMVIPGVNFVAEQAWSEPFIRGVGQNANGPGIENSVATYVDGVYRASMIGGATDFNNVESVQVLSGPQGTLFGRNATGGAILITTLTPSHTVSGSVSLGDGNFQTATGDAYVTGGLSNTLAADFAVDWSNQGQGYARNLFNGTEVAKNRKLFVRNKWLFTPNDRVTLTLALDYGQLHFGTDQAPAQGTQPPGGAPSLPPFDIDGPYPNGPGGHVKDGGVALTADINLEPLRFKSITAWRDTKSETTENGWLSPDIDGDQYLDLFEPHTQVSQEFQLLSPTEWRLHWTVGLYYFHEESRYDPVILHYSDTNFIVSPLTDIVEYTHSTTNSYAAYAEATYDLRPDTRLTAGFRYTTEPRTTTVTESVLADGINFGTFTDTGSKTFSAPSWRLVLDHDFTQNVLGYVSYNHGFKSGGFNVALVPVTSFEPEKIDAYEIGVKTLTLDRRLRLNVSAFYYDDKNIQVESFPPPEAILAIENGPEARLYGIDLIGDASITKNLSLHFGVNWLHAYFVSYPNAFFTAPIPGGGTAFSTFDAAGQPVPHAPRATWSVGPTYTIPSSIGNFTLNAEYYHNSGWNAEPDGRLHQDAYGLLNARFAWLTPDGKYGVDLWGKNLQNTAYAFQYIPSSAGDSLFWAPPRTYGVTLRANF